MKMKKITMPFANHIVVIILALATVCALYYNISLNIHEETDLSVVPNMKDISCYKDKARGTLRKNLLNTNQTIFFIESSCKGGLNSRQACSVEAAANANPDWSVVVLFPGPQRGEFLKSAHYQQLTSSDIQLARIRVKDFSRGTPLEGLFASKKLQESDHPVVHSSDVLRILTLYKFGGVYLDLDVLVVKPLNSLPQNFVGKESKEAIANGIMRISHDQVGSNFSRIAIMDLASSFEPHTWNGNGPGLMSRTLAKLCNTSHVPDMTADNCQGFAVLEPKMLYPIPYPSWRRYYEDWEPVIGDEYTHHMWNAFSQEEKVPQNSMYARLAQKFCPGVYRLFGSEFGS